MSLSQQIAELEDELEGYRNGSELKDLENRIEELELENADYCSELRSLEDANSEAQDIKASMSRIEDFIYDLEEAHSSIQCELNKLT